MADNRLTIETATVFDNSTDRQVEFSGTVDGETYRFAAQYSLVQALTGAIPDAPATAMLALTDTVAKAALVALGRATGDDIVVVSERDLEGATAESGGAQPPVPVAAEAEAHPS
jgi:hypothetical protein